MEGEDKGRQSMYLAKVWPRNQGLKFYYNFVFFLSIPKLDKRGIKVFVSGCAKKKICPLGKWANGLVPALKFT